MPEPNDTWESAATPTPEPVAPVTETPVVETPTEPTAEATTLETTSQLAAEPVARESESQQAAPDLPPEASIDEDVEDDDAPEILALPTGSQSRKWARRQFKDAKPIREFLDFESPISTLGDQLHGLSPSRYTEHVNDIFRRHSKDLLGVPFDEVKSRLQTNGKPATTTPATAAEAQASQSVSLPTETELGQMTNEQVTQRIKQIQEQERQALSAQFQKKVDDLTTRLEAVDGKLTTKEQADQQMEIEQKQNELYTKVWSVVEDGIRDSGLEVLPADPPKIASLKRAAARLLDKHNIEAAFDAVDDNTKLVEYVFKATNRREYQNAFREEDNLKVRARAAFESVKQSPEVKAIIDEIEAYANQSKGTSRAANPIPPGPGSALGVTVTPPGSWDEAIAQAKAAA